MATHALSTFDRLIDDIKVVPATEAAPEPLRVEPAAFRSKMPPRIPAKFWSALTVVVLHVAVLGALLTYRHMNFTAKPPVALVLLDVSAPPPEQREVPPEIVDLPPVVIPPPVIQIENPPPSVTAVVMENPPPRQPAPTASVVAEGPASPAPMRRPSVAPGDLSASMIEAMPPRYPHESRRLKEQGTVVLEVLLKLDGRVERIAVRTSSGFRRLDNAALEAVRRWRWSPRVLDGEQVAVRGLVEIPFQLTPGRHGS